MDTIITILLILAVLLLTVLLFLTVRPRSNPITDEKIDNLGRGLGELRRDTAAQNEAVRSAVASSLGGMAEKVDAAARASSAQAVETVKTLSAMSEKADRSDREQTQAVTAAIEKLQLSNEKKLEEMRATVDEKLTNTLNARIDSSFKSVSEQLQNVYRSLGEMKELSGGVTALNRIFSNVKTRGNWAETQLEGILDKIIPGMYVRNYSPNDNREAVEFAVMIPDSDGGQPTYLPIDSKFPMEDYLRLCAAADEGDAEGVKAARRALEGRVLAEARAVSKYIVQPQTTPFAVLYLATDALYAEVLSSRENLADKLHDEYSVLLTGPSTVTALLSSLAMGFRTVALNQKANEVMDLLAAAKQQYDKFGAALEKARRKLDEAGQSLDDAQHRNDIIVKKLKNVETVGHEALTDFSEE